MYKRKKKRKKKDIMVECLKTGDEKRKLNKIQILMTLQEQSLNSNFSNCFRLNAFCLLKLI